MKRNIPTETRTPVTAEVALLIRQKREYFKNCLYWIEEGDSIEKVLSAISSLKIHLKEIESITKKQTK